MIDLKEKIEYLRNQRGFSKENVYEAVDMTRQGFEQAIKNHTLSFDKIQKLAKFFNVDVNYFSNNENDFTQINLHGNIDKQDILTYKEMYEKLLAEKERQILTLEKDKDELTKKLDKLEKIVFDKLLTPKHKTNEFGDCGRIEDDWYLADIAKDYDSVPSAAVVTC